MSVKPSTWRSNPAEISGTLSAGQIRLSSWFILTVIMVVLLVETDLVAATEDCINGRDDDGDFATDCNDLDCAQDFACPSMNIQNVPSITIIGTVDSSATVTLRRNICRSAGSTYNTYSTSVITDDQCLYPRTACPRVTLDTRTTIPANNGRKGVCKSAGCYFSEGGGESDEPTVVYNYAGDDCSPYYQDERRYRQVDGSTCEGVWSYLPGEVQSAPPPPVGSKGARRIGCCLPSLDRCVNDLGTCFDFGEVEVILSPLICGSGNDWDKCGQTLDRDNVNALPGTVSDDRDHICFLAGETYLWLPIGDEICTNERDDDYDSLIDCADRDCYGRDGPGGINCPTPETMCMDRMDNDGDGLADCTDSDCDGQLVSSTGTGDILCEYGAETSCADVFDNDGDGSVDKNDYNCLNTPCTRISSNGGGAGVWVWSHVPTDANYESMGQEAFPPLVGTMSRRIGCCSIDQCVTLTGLCYSPEKLVSSTSQSICGEKNNWDNCGSLTYDANSDGRFDNNKGNGGVSDGRLFQCNYPTTDTDGRGNWVNQESLCTDTFDNDGDTFVDCADPGCSTNSACPICMDITLLPGGTGSAMSTRERERSDVCASVGCSLVPLDEDSTNDECRGIRTGCPTVAFYSTAGSIYNDGRRDICTNVGCVFIEGEGVVLAGSGDLCTAAVIVLDGDGDGFSDSVDNCPSVSNLDQLDTDGDRMGDVCDSDDDGDGVLDVDDGCANTPAGELVDILGCSDSQRDSDGDGINDGGELEACVEAPGTYPEGATFFTSGPFIGCRRGDMNDDGYVTIADYTPWLSAYDVSATESKGDLNVDSMVDIADYTPWLSQYDVG